MKKYFKLKREVRQGDPLSAHLFRFPFTQIRKKRLKILKDLQLRLFSMD